LQEIEVAALVRLQHVLAVEPGVAALRDRPGGYGTGGLTATGELGLLDQEKEIEPTLADRKPDPVAVADEAERPARSRDRRNW
jgi:hypothetical protein